MFILKIIMSFNILSCWLSHICM